MKRAAVVFVAVRGGVSKALNLEFARPCAAREILFEVAEPKFPIRIVPIRRGSRNLNVWKNSPISLASKSLARSDAVKIGPSLLVI